jgi:hypothetical protein
MSSPQLTLIEASEDDALGLQMPTWQRSERN